MGLLDGGVALVTGAGSGIGRASAQVFAREGAGSVVVSDIDVDGGEETAASIRDAGTEASFVRCDVSSEADVQSLVDETLHAYGRIDYAHNNAGLALLPALLTDVSEADWERLMQVNLKGVWLCMKHEIRAMLPNRDGAIVNTASVLALGGQPYMAAYSASKHGVVGLTKTAAAEFAQAGIRVNVICPGAVATPMQERSRDALVAMAGGTPAGKQAAPAAVSTQRIGEPIEQAEAAVWLCSRRASYVNGASLSVDGGLTAASHQAGHISNGDQR